MVRINADTNAGDPRPLAALTSADTAPVPTNVGGAAGLAPMFCSASAAARRRLSGSLGLTDSIRLGTAPALMTAAAPRPPAVTLTSALQAARRQSRSSEPAMAQRGETPFALSRARRPSRSTVTFRSAVAAATLRHGR
eukprot:scaffold141613_cov42-Prasinocladus_malaysianus.AAC.1